MDSSDLVQLIKQASKETMHNLQPSDFVYGVVLTESPLKIQVEQKITLGSAQLVLTRNVTNYKTKITTDAIQVEYVTQGDKKPLWIKEQEVTIHNGLKAGEKVVMVKALGGQKYLVLDRVVE